MNSTIFKRLFLIPVLVVLVMASAANMLWGANLKVHILDVGQGDCELIVSPTGKTVLIDAGNNGKGKSVVLPYLNNLDITDLDYIVSSHYDADHIGGMDEVVAGLGGSSHILSAAYDRGGSVSGQRYTDYTNAVGDKRTTITPGQVINLGGGAVLTCIAADGKTKNGTVYPGKKENELSVVVKLDYLDFQAYFGGDSGKDIEEDLDSLVGNIDVYKVGHHGDDSSSSQSFLDIIQPEVSTISVGNNDYGHPSSIVHTRLGNIGSYIYQTEIGKQAPPTGKGEVANGSFTIETDGSTYTVTGFGLNTATYYTDGSNDGPHIVFSEVLYDSAVSGDTAGEWLELYNPKAAAVDIGGWSIQDNAQTYNIPLGTAIGAQSYLVIANDSSTFNQEYGCDPDISGLTLRLNNDGDYLTLKNSSGAVIDQVAWESGGSNVSGWGSSSQPYADEGKSIARSDVYQDTDRYIDWLNNQNPDPVNIPNIMLNRTQLYFGAANGAETSSQSFLISNPGGGTLNWTVSTNANWLSCTPTHGSETGLVSVSINSTGLPAGTYSGTVTINAPNATNSPQNLVVTLEVYNATSTSIPFGSFSTPSDGAVVQSSIPVTGWVLDDIEVVSVKLYNGTEYVGDAVFVEGARPDVEQAYPDYPKSYQAGWGYMMLTNFLPNGGNGTYTLYSIATDAEGNQVTLGSKTINVDNAHAVKPFGAIDTPSQGGTASGRSFINAGWALTPQPNSIPINGATIDVYVDGVNLGHPTYNIYRSDIAALMPGYTNSSGAGGYFNLDTTAYKNGIHTIHWIATDSAGNWDGIGSRYFTIQNTGNYSRLSEREPNGLPPYLSSYPFWYEDIREDNPGEFVEVIKGYSNHGQCQKIYPGENGIIPVEIKELERVEIHFHEETKGLTSMAENSDFSFTTGTWTGYQSISDGLRPLPAGTTMDSERGVFYWQPGVGFIGTYEFLFLQKSNPRIKKRISIRIEPKF